MGYGQQHSSSHGHGHHHHGHHHHGHLKHQKSGGNSSGSGSGSGSGAAVKRTTGSRRSLAAATPAGSAHANSSSALSDAAAPPVSPPRVTEHSYSRWYKDEIWNGEDSDSARRQQGGQQEQCAGAQGGKLE